MYNYLTYNNYMINNSTLFFYKTDNPLVYNILYLLSMATFGMLFLAFFCLPIGRK